MKKIFCVFGAYLVLLGWGVGMLRAAQQTRRLLSGGQPVMAAVHPADSGTVLQLGGGEWEIALPPENNISRTAALPPCAVRLIVRLYEITGQTAEVIGRMAAFFSE
ncbi:MAG: hypothetical protein IK130_08090 [Oscillospiraceae bacterium]|nr:hypothetical protein [Oscillospiraceae bacterium]